MNRRRLAYLSCLTLSVALIAAALYLAVTGDWTSSAMAAFAGSAVATGAGRFQTEA